MENNKPLSLKEKAQAARELLDMVRQHVKPTGGSVNIDSQVQEAKDAAKAAANSATDAETAKNKAKESADNAKTSETNASNSATATETAKNEAKDAATDAANSATDAETAKNEAKESADNAKTSETNASNSATAAQAALQAMQNYDFATEVTKVISEDQRVKELLEKVQSSSKDDKTSEEQVNNIADQVMSKLIIPVKDKEGNVTKEVQLTDIDGVVAIYKKPIIDAVKTLYKNQKDKMGTDASAAINAELDKPEFKDNIQKQFDIAKKNAQESFVKFYNEKTGEFEATLKDTQGAVEILIDGNQKSALDLLESRGVDTSKNCENDKGNTVNFNTDKCLPSECFNNENVLDVTGACNYAITSSLTIYPFSE